MSADTLKSDERALLEAYRSVILAQHGRVTVEIHDGKPKIMEHTVKTKLS